MSITLEGDAKLTWLLVTKGLKKKIHLHTIDHKIKKERKNRYQNATTISREDNDVFP